MTAFEPRFTEVKEEEEIDKKGETIKVVRWSKKELGRAFKLPAATALIQAGSRVYTGAGHELLALDFDRKTGFSPAWKKTVDGTIARLIAADDRLFVVTFEGELLCFGSGQAVQTHEKATTAGQGRRLDHAGPEHSRDYQHCAAVIAWPGVRALDAW